MSIRFLKRATVRGQKQYDSYSNQISGIRQIQRLVKPTVHLNLHNRCICQICANNKPILNVKKEKVNEFTESSRKNHDWLKKILVGLTDKVQKSLKIFIPDILFITPDGLQIFSTNKKDYRIIKFAGTTPTKAIYNTLIRLRKQYKGMLEQNFRKTMIDKINPQFMHAKYYDKLLPSHFHDGDGSRTLNENKSKFKKYVLHKNQKYIIGAIQQHKMNEKQPFCTLRYIQGNWQLLNQKQFENLLMVKIPDDVVYVQSYIKSKQSQALIFSKYTEDSLEIDKVLFKKAELEMMVLLGGLGKYDDGYDELENFQDATDQMMKQNPNKYVELMTYKLVHFLAMVANIYIRHIKIKWIINDIDTVYLQQIIEFASDSVSNRKIRYKLPPTTQLKNFYQDANFFVQIHKQLKRKKQQGLIKIRQQLQNKRYEEISIDSNTIQNLNKQPKEYLNQRLGDFGRSIRSQKNQSFLDMSQDINLKESFHKNKYFLESITKQSMDRSTKFKTSLNSARSKQIQKLGQNSKRYDHKEDKVPHRRSISSFQYDIITRNQRKFIDLSRSRLNKSVNRYQMNTIDHHQINKSLHWQLNKPNQKFTIDF